MSARATLRRFGRDEAGAALVEFTLAIALLLLLFFGLIDFGRLAYHWTAAEKATSIAARIASVRPSACTGVLLPETYGRGSNTTLRFGTTCAVAGACTTPAPVTCLGAAGNATVDEIWGRIAPLLPNDATPANLRFRYASDYGRSMGFLGGPYVPAVTVELTGLVFRFATPLSGLANLASGTTGSTISDDIQIPSMSVTLPGEDLNVGTTG